MLVAAEWKLKETFSLTFFCDFLNLPRNSLSFLSCLQFPKVLAFPPVHSAVTSISSSFLDSPQFPTSFLKFLEPDFYHVSSSSKMLALLLVYCAVTSINSGFLDFPRFPLSFHEFPEIPSAWVSSSFLVYKDVGLAPNPLCSSISSSFHDFADFPRVSTSSLKFLEIEFLPVS